MIKATELRIGNLIYLLIKDETGGKVKARLEKEISIHDLSIMLDIEDKAKDFFEPIQLTEQILMRAGFESGGGFINGDVFSVYTKHQLTYNTLHGWWIYNRKADRQIKYVHQLQNLFYALTCEELQINL